MKIFILCLLFFCTNAWAEAIWSSQPVKYKPHLVVETHLMGLVFSTFIFDNRYMSEFQGIISVTNTLLFDHAKIAQESAVAWVEQNHASLRVYVPCNHEEIGIPQDCVPPHAPRSLQQLNEHLVPSFRPHFFPDEFGNVRKRLRIDTDFADQVEEKIDDPPTPKHQRTQSDPFVVVYLEEGKAPILSRVNTDNAMEP